MSSADSTDDDHHPADLIGGDECLPVRVGAGDNVQQGGLEERIEEVGEVGRGLASSGDELESGSGGLEEGVGRVEEPALCYAGISIYPRHIYGISNTCSRCGRDLGKTEIVSPPAEKIPASVKGLALFEWKTQR